MRRRSERWTNARESRACARSGGGRFRVVPGASIEFPLQTLNRGVEFACPNGSGIGDPVSGHHELRNLVGPILHGGEVVFRLAELSNREWVSILHPDSKCTDTRSATARVAFGRGDILKGVS